MVKRDKEGQYLMIKWSIPQEYKDEKMYAHNIRAPKYI